jgi:putative ABC transport system permease protein
VGALFGGASPVEAAQFQLVVLAGVALAMVVTGVVVTRLAGHTPYVVPDETRG